MPLTANAIPSQTPDFATPYDAMLAFSATGVAAAITATGYLGAPSTVDLGGALPTSGAGRTDGVWCLNITAIDMATTDEVYRFALMGSNDSAFGNGNVELLGFYDFAALAANRIVPTIMGASSAIPPAGKAGARFVRPFTNLSGQIVYRYLRAYVTIPAAGSSITVLSWISKAEIKV